MFARIVTWIKTARSREPESPLPEAALPPPPVQPAPLRIYQTREVFRPTGMPTVTMVDRSETDECKEIRYHLDEIGGLVSVYGDSKSGKTILCLDILKEHNPILLWGRHVKEERIFWQELSRHLDDPQIASSELYADDVRRPWTQLEEAGTEFEQVTLQSLDEPASEGQKPIQKEASASEVTERWIKSKRPVIVDDFHATPPHVQQHIIDSLKPGFDQGCTFIAVSIPEETESIVRNISQGGEEIARYAIVRAPAWQPADIAQIPTKGFEALQIGIDRGTIESLIRFSYRNPLLMQSYCSRLCFALKIRQTVPVRKEYVIETEVVDRVIRETAAQYHATFGDYIHLDDERDAKYLLATGENANLDTVVLLAIADVSVDSAINVSTVCERIDRILVKGIRRPRTGDVTNAVRKMAEKMLDKLGQNAPLIYVPEKRQVHIAHPFFKVFLQWHLVPLFKGISARPRR